VNIDKKQKQYLNDSLLLFYTGMTRDSGYILSDQKARIVNNNDSLKKLAFLAELGKEKLAVGTINDIGKLLHDNWELKKMLSTRISNQEIDDMYQLARDAGAIGGKITGAGSGGFMLLCVNDGKRDYVREAMKDYRELPFNLENDGSKIIFNCRRSV
jgi:D-glycero-alpha-D-manno-heptose-7-phosphate kinase